MSSDTTTEPTTTTTTKPKTNSRRVSWSDSYTKSERAIQSLSPILTSIPPPLLSADNPAFSLLHDPDVASQISALLREPDSGAGENNLCRWLYDTFQTSDTSLQLVVLRFLPIIAGVYLSRVALRKPLAGFEAVFLALYAHETAFRNGQSITVNIPDLSHSSIYHETKQTTTKNSSMELNLGVISPTLEPHGTVRSTRRARIVGVALELYYSKISQMPIDSKIDFCQFCEVWAGQDGNIYMDGIDDKMGESEVSELGGEKDEKDKGVKEGRIPLPWELLQPVLRILGHCMMGPTGSKELHEAACAACRSLYARSLHDINPKAILATGSLLRLGKIGLDSNDDDFDHTEISMSSSISL
ncbi:uncharacterized protein LOC132309232 [Cornus florida]|uniref:uncharacterized protein LOC132309232 n=1 Tax=Cornus florida TaxID=4283 RepID=UPI0028A0B984|nr:uncharacterized protein LOC132309232 [Cornus florida]